METANPERSRQATILVVENEPAVAAQEREVLELSGYRVVEASTGEQGKRLAGEMAPDLIILDLLVPDIDGLVLCANLRATTAASIVVVTDAQHHRDVVLALKLGADDCVAKPFDANELEARVEAVLRRRVPEQGRPLAPAADVRIGDLVLHPSRRTAEANGHVLPVTPTEFLLLLELARHPGVVVGRDQLAEAAWGRADATSSRTIDVHMRKVRALLQRYDGRVPSILSVRGQGYRLNPHNGSGHASAA